jgi:hypothetical protein
LIAPAEDTKDKFTAKILDILRDDSLYRFLAMNAKSSLSEEYTLPAMANRYKQIFDELTAGRPGLK